MLGVESLCGQWAEWLTSVPLIVYMAIAVEDKKALDKIDGLIIVSCFMCIFFGFILNISTDDNSSLGIVLLTLSFGAIGFTIICLCCVSGKSLEIKL